MREITQKLLWLCLCVWFLTSCKNQAGENVVLTQENKEAKALLQGIWVNADDEEVAFRAKGDTIYYPDSTSMPVRFRIIGDSLELGGVTTYPIVKQTANLFQFKNQNGETVKLIKSENPLDQSLFEHRQPAVINQNKLIKRDTVVSYHGERYHCYVQVNPTRYKVIKATYNDEGVEVGNIYYDNIIHISVYHGAAKLYSHDFYKKDFARQVPAPFLEQSILSDMVYTGIDEQGVHYQALLGIPDSPSSYAVETIISYQGAVYMRVRNE